MNDLKRIQVRYGGRTVDAVLLGIYTRENYRFQKTFFELLFCKKTKSNLKTVMQKTHLVFLPWKHRMKQLAEIRESDVTALDGSFPAEWISVPQYTSIGTEEYRPSIPITDFFGYPFVFQHNSFIADQISGEYEANLKILYTELPELLREEFDEENK